MLLTGIVFAVIGLVMVRQPESLLEMFGSKKKEHPKALLLAIRAAGVALVALGIFSAVAEFTPSPET